MSPRKIISIRLTISCQLSSLRQSRKPCNSPPDWSAKICAKEILSPAAYRRHNQNFQPIRHLGAEAVGKADGIVAHKDVDVLANAALLVKNAVAESGMILPERFQRGANRRRRARNFQLILSAGKGSQVGRNAKGDRHGLSLFRVRFLFWRGL